MNDITLVHLVSEQTLQNLLPTLALKPRRVLQVRSNDNRFKDSPAYLEKACRAADLKYIEFLPPETIPSDSPDIEETSRFFDSLFERHKSENLCLNFTGGTKLMSIGAFRVAEHLRIPSLYTDSLNRHEFVDAHTGAWPVPLDSMQSLTSGLSVPVVMAAHGKVFKAADLNEKLLGFGATAWSLRLTDHATIAVWTKSIRDSLPRDSNNRISSNPQNLRAFVQNKLPPRHSEAAEAYLEAAAEAGLITVDISGCARPNVEAKKSSVENFSNLLDGGWLELAVLNFARAGSRFQDMRWSVEPPANTPPSDFGETDLIAVETSKLGLAIFSCKSSLEHVPQLEHLAAWRDRARALGGSHAHAHLCLFQAKSPDQANTLKTRGEAMNVKVLMGEEIPAYFVS